MRLHIPWFSAWKEFTPVIPAMYSNVESGEQRIHAICAQLHKLVCYVDYLGGHIDLNKQNIEELKTLFEKFIASGFEDYYERQIIDWIDNHLNFIFTHVAKQVFFGLTLDGHFIAYIPDSWDDIIFDTGAVYGLDTYGRLILRWDVDNSNYSVNQRPEDWS